MTGVFELKIESVFHITHFKNLKNIQSHGLLSYSVARSKQVLINDISNQSVQEKRQKQEPIYGRPLHDYVPSFFNPRNAMLYSRRDLQDRLVILEISIEIIKEIEYLFTNGNAAANDAEFFNSFDDFERLPWNHIMRRNWYDMPIVKNRMMSEILAYPGIPTKYIRRLHYKNHSHNGFYLKSGFASRWSPEKFF